MIETPYLTVDDAGRVTAGTRPSHVVSDRGVLAAQLAERIAGLRGAEGDDVLYSVGFIAKRACDLADALFEQYQERGWLLPLDPETPKEG